MNEYLFTMANVVISCDQGDFDLDDTEFSCLYSIYTDRDGERPCIDLMSFKYMEWRAGKKNWVPCPPLPQYLIAALEDRIQLKLDDDARTVEANQIEVAAECA
jgi:hypothetical protein